MEMVLAHITYMLASTYGSGQYDTTVYNGSAGSSSGALSNTGLMIAGIVTVAAATLLVAMIVRIWKRPAKKLQAEDTDAED